MSKHADEQTKCAEHGVWTSVPTPPPAGQQSLNLSAIDADENQRIISSGKMSFAMVGCSGDPDTHTNTETVAYAITADNDTSFFFHLGDIVYLKRAATRPPMALKLATRLSCGTPSFTLPTPTIRSASSPFPAIMMGNPRR
jgi:hypothetical protein